MRTLIYILGIDAVVIVQKIYGIYVQPDAILALFVFFFIGFFMYVDVRDKR